MGQQINLKDFIVSVKKELIAAQEKKENSSFQLDEVILEVSFAFDSTARGSGKFFVVEVGGEIKSTQTHKVTLKLSPYKKPSKANLDFLKSSSDKNAGTLFDQGVITYIQTPSNLRVPKLKNIASARNSKIQK
jgi:hypothetical protein